MTCSLHIAEYLVTIPLYCQSLLFLKLISLMGDHPNRVGYLYYMYMNPSKVPLLFNFLKARRAVCLVGVLEVALQLRLL